MHPGIQTALTNLPSWLFARSGKIFYSGPSAFDGNRSIYLLGLNPGGDENDRNEETIQDNLQRHTNLTQPYSEYIDGIWKGRPAGVHGMQPRLQHLARKLDIDLRDTPSSNVIFQRSRREHHLDGKDDLLELCWPIHEAVIKSLNIRMILCFGKTAGKWVRKRTQANHVVDHFTERNKRCWKSEAHQNDQGLTVCTLTHPSIANWCNPDSDPSEMILRCMTSQT